MTRTTIFAMTLGACLPAVRAQDTAVYLGVGTAWDSSNGAQVDTFGDGTVHSASHMSGVFIRAGGNVFFNRRWGAGAELSGRSFSSDYAGLKARPSFYSVDAIYRPIRGASERYSPEVHLGIGGARVSYNFDDDTACAQVPGCPGVHRFQAHAGFDTRIYVRDHVFFRPAVDVHYVRNFGEYGSNWVPEFSFSIGYSLGRK